MLLYKRGAYEWSFVCIWLSRLYFLFLGEVLAVVKLNKQHSLAEGRESGKKGVKIGFGMQHALLTLARASTLAPFLSKIRIMSVWLALAARCRGVSPLTVGTSGLASCCSRNITIFIHPIKLATCNGVSPDCKTHVLSVNISIWLQN